LKAFRQKDLSAKATRAVQEFLTYIKGRYIDNPIYASELIKSDQFSHYKLKDSHVREMRRFLQHQFEPVMGYSKKGYWWAVKPEDCELPLIELRSRKEWIESDIQVITMIQTQLRTGTPIQVGMI
jgi:hypothetical protein